MYLEKSKQPGRYSTNKHQVKRKKWTDEFSRIFKDFKSDICTLHYVSKVFHKINFVLIYIVQYNNDTK